MSAGGLKMGTLRLVLAVGWLGGGCAYRGAIYASYQEAGLGIKATAESDAPVKVHFGYNRGVGAWVPRRGGSAAAEEATALISRDDVRAGVNPTKRDQPLLQVDGAVITGTAAIVAAAPANATVTIRDSAGAATYETHGTAGHRITTALAGPLTLSSDELALKRLIQRTSERADGDQVFQSAASALSPVIGTRYRKLAARLAARKAFTAVAIEYQGEDETGVRIRELVDALRAANEEVH
jgi:hypothetical protein